MAKPIQPTPVLEGKDAYNFLIEMNEPKSKKHNKILEDILKKDLPLLF